MARLASYIIGVKMVLPNGDLLEVTEDKRSRFDAEKSDRAMALRDYLSGHVSHPPNAADGRASQNVQGLAEFTKALPELIALDYSIMYYVFPFVDKITIEFRK